VGTYSPTHPARHGGVLQKAPHYGFSLLKTPIPDPGRMILNYLRGLLFKAYTNISESEVLPILPDLHPTSPEYASIEMIVFERLFSLAAVPPIPWMAAPQVPIDAKIVALRRFC